MCLLDRGVRFCYGKKALIKFSARKDQRKTSIKVQNDKELKKQDYEQEGEE